MTKFTKSKYHDLIRGLFEPAPKNKNVPDFAYNPLSFSGELYTPIIDIEWLRKNKPPVWPDRKSVV